MKAISIIFPTLAAFSSGSLSAPLEEQDTPTLTVPCEKYDMFIHLMCQWQMKHDKQHLVGNFCKPGPSCHTAPEVQVQGQEYYFYRVWSGDSVDPETVKVDCEEYDEFINYKCQIQAKEHPQLIGGWCGRPPVCFSSPFFIVDKSNDEYFQWYMGELIAQDSLKG